MAQQDQRGMHPSSILRTNITQGVAYPDNVTMRGQPVLHIAHLGFPDFMQMRGNPGVQPVENPKVQGGQKRKKPRRQKLKGKGVYKSHCHAGN